MLAALMPAVSAAADLVPGGALTLGSDAGAGGSGFKTTGSGGLVMGFTPRGGVDGGDGDGEGIRLSLRLGRDTLAGEGVDRMALSAIGSSPWNREEDKALTVGGSLEWNDWHVGGSYQRPDLTGLPEDFVGASIGYGSISAQLAYGESDDPAVADEPGVWLFSTDIGAAPWLSFEGDLALQPRENEEQEAVGRVGIKLKF